MYCSSRSRLQSIVVFEVMFEHKGFLTRDVDLHIEVDAS